MKYIALYLLSIVLVFTSCKDKQELVNFQSSFEKYAIGSGGGFTGKYVEYMIQSNGQVTLNEFDGNIKVLGTINGKDVQTLFISLDRLDPISSELMNVGNMNYYIEVYRNHEKKRIQWSDQIDPSEQEAQDFYNETISALEKAGILD